MSLATTPSIQNTSTSCTISTNNNSTTTTATAMTLWNKFHNWQHDMDTCRHTIQNIRQQYDQCIQQINTLHTIRKHEILQIHQIEYALTGKQQQQHDDDEEKDKDYDTISGDSNMKQKETTPSYSIIILQQLQSTLHRIEQKYDQMIRSIQEIKQQYSIQTTLQKDMIQYTIIEQCHIFQQQCSQLHHLLRTTADVEYGVTSSSSPNNNGHVNNNHDWDDPIIIETSTMVHNLRATIYSILAVDGSTMDMDSSSSDKPQHDMTNHTKNYSNELQMILHELEQCHHFDALDTTIVDDEKYNESIHDNDDDKKKDDSSTSITNNIPVDDTELCTAIDKYHIEQQSMEQMKVDLQTIQMKHDTLIQKQNDRNTNIQQLKQQIQRLQNDCSTMEMEIIQYQDLLLEDTVMADAYRTKINQRLQNRSNHHNTEPRRIGFHNNSSNGTTTTTTTNISSGFVVPSSKKQRFTSVATLIPPIVNTTPTEKFSVKQKENKKNDDITNTNMIPCIPNPYTTTKRKRHMVTNKESSMMTKTMLPMKRHTDRNHHSHHEIASIVLGHPIASITNCGHNDSIVTTTDDEPVLDFLYDTIVEPTNHSEMNTSVVANLESSNVDTCLDGDVAAGTTIMMDGKQNHPGVTNSRNDDHINLIPTSTYFDDDDDDILEFVAFPTCRQGRVSK